MTDIMKIQVAGLGSPRVDNTILYIIGVEGDTYTLLLLTSKYKYFSVPVFPSTNWLEYNGCPLALVNVMIRDMVKP